MGLHQRYDKCYGFHGKDELLPRVSWEQMFLVSVDISRLGCCARYEVDTGTCEKKERDSLDVCLLEWHIYYRILKSTNTWRGIYWCFSSRRMCVDYASINLVQWRLGQSYWQIWRSWWWSLRRPNQAIDRFPIGSIRTKGDTSRYPKELERQTTPTSNVRSRW